MKPSRDRECARSGFTLAEVAVTIVIVSITLVLVLQGLNTAKVVAAHTFNRKMARELALVTLGKIEAGMFWEDLDGEAASFSGSYAEEGYESFYWELFIGEDVANYEETEEGYFDSYAYRRSLDEEDAAEDEDSPFGSGSTGGPYERVTIRVIFPQLGDQPNELTMERWIPLEQVYGKDPQAREQDDEDES